jgi:hypothetical protein
LRAQGFVAQAEAVHRARAEVLDQHVHALDQVEAELDALGLFQIDADAALAAIQAEKEVRLTAGKGRSPAAAHISRARFQLIDLRAVIREEERAIRPGERMRKVEHANAVQRTARCAPCGAVYIHR